MNNTIHIYLRSRKASFTQNRNKDEDWCLHLDFRDVVLDENFTMVLASAVLFHFRGDV